MKKITNEQAKRLESAYKVLILHVDKSNTRVANALRILSQIIKRTKL